MTAADDGPRTLTERRERLAEIVKRLPVGPGVYLFKDVTGAVAYVGKARRLRDRVRSYFSRSQDGRRAVRFVDRYVHDIAFIARNIGGLRPCDVTAPETHQVRLMDPSLYDGRARPGKALCPDVILRPSLFARLGMLHGM